MHEQFSFEPYNSRLHDGTGDVAFDYISQARQMLSGGCGPTGCDRFAVGPQSYSSNYDTGFGIDLGPIRFRLDDGRSSFSQYQPADFGQDYRMGYRPDFGPGIRPGCQPAMFPGFRPQFPGAIGIDFRPDPGYPNASFTDRQYLDPRGYPGYYPQTRQPYQPNDFSPGCDSSRFQPRNPGRQDFGRAIAGFALAMVFNRVFGHHQQRFSNNRFMGRGTYSQSFRHRR